jgi:hypothetical protein
MVPFTNQFYFTQVIKVFGASGHLKTSLVKADEIRTDPMRLLLKTQSISTLYHYKKNKVYIV